MKKRPSKETANPPVDVEHEEDEEEEEEDEEDEEEIDDDIVSSHSVLTQVDLLRDSGDERQTPMKTMKTMKKR